MEYRLAYKILEDVFNEIISDFPLMESATYRDGGSIAFFFPENKIKNIILLAKVHWADNGGRVIKEIKILDHGCTQFEDSYDKKNVLEIITADEKIDSDKMKSVIKEAIIRRMNHIS